MSFRRDRRFWLAGLFAGLLALGIAADADAQRKSKTERFNGRYQGFDAATSTIKVKEKGKEEVFSIKPEGSVLTRTTVKINGRGAKIAELPMNAPVIVYWIPDEADAKKKFAR